MSDAVSTPRPGGNSKAPFGVYIHWPFCAQKCPYCDFNSHVRFQGWDEGRLLKAYLRELSWVRERIGGRTVSSVFFGGGTPSLMQPETTGAILDHIARLWPAAAAAEVTLEANPGSVEAERFKGYRAAGVNRVSMGMQSLRDSELKKLGRIHTVAEAKAALDIARRTFDRYSFDLIYARPGQLLADWREELHEALALAGDHISLYQLTIEPYTPYAALHAAGKLVVPDADLARGLFETTAEMTEARGLPAYEISNHARPGEESRHNLLYWRYGEYAGVGPGAHGRLLFDASRYATVAERHPESWTERVEAHGHGCAEVTALSAAEEADEVLLMGLRLREGLDLEALEALGNVRPMEEMLAHLERLGLIETARERGFATSRPNPGGYWRGNELNVIPMCAGPGLPLDREGPPEPGQTAAAVSTRTKRIRATPDGRFVLNAIVAELSKSLRPAA